MALEQLSLVCLPGTGASQAERLERAQAEIYETHNVSTVMHPAYPGLEPRETWATRPEPVRSSAPTLASRLGHTHIPVFPAKLCSPPSAPASIRVSASIVCIASPSCPIAQDDSSKNDHHSKWHTRYCHIKGPRPRSVFLDQTPVSEFS